MAIAFSIPKNDLLPILAATLTDEAGPINLTGASVKFQMRLPGSATLKVDTAAAVVTPSAGTVTYTWTLGDTNTSGLYIGWFLITFAGPKNMEAPNPPLVIQVTRGPG